MYFNLASSGSFSAEDDSSAADLEGFPRKPFWIHMLSKGVSTETPFESMLGTTVTNYEMWASELIIKIVVNSAVMV